MDMAGFFAPEYISAEEYLKRRYEIPEKMPELPLTDEPFVSLWAEKEGQGVLDFLSEEFELPASGFQWENIAALKISFAESLGGRLPAIATQSHSDFRAMEALLNGRKKMQAYAAGICICKGILFAFVKRSARNSYRDKLRIPL